MNITVAEILAELAKAHEVSTDIPPNTFSSEEIRGALGLSKERFPKVMRPLMEAGNVVTVRVRKQAIDGRMMSVPYYQFRA